MNLLRLACLAAGLFALAACSSAGKESVTPEPTGSGPGASSAPEPSAPQRIVFVSPEFDVWTILDDGAGPEHVIGGGASDPLPGPSGSGSDVSFHPQQAHRIGYTWPTWSPDGRAVALSRLPGLGDAVASLVVLGHDSSGERQLHETQPGSVGLVAATAPHYALWAPDSQLISFVAPRGTGQGLGLFVVDPANGDPYEVVPNAPLYHVWSPDARYVLVHRREQLLLHDTRERSTRELDASSFRYRVPSFSPDGERIAYVVDEGDFGQLVTSDLDGAGRVTLTDFPGVAAFAYAPNDGRLAVVTRTLSNPSYDALYVLGEDGRGGDGPLVRGTFGGFYWSPDGSRLAYVTLGDSFEWHVADPATGETQRLTQFIPTPDFLTHVQFFDQFAPSHLVWSADSTKLVFAGVLGSNETPGVWVVDAVGGSPPRRIADGRLAFWVPPTVE